MGGKRRELKVESLSYGVKSQEQVGERVEAEDLYKDAGEGDVGAASMGPPDHGLA